MWKLSNDWIYCLIIHIMMSFYLFKKSLQILNLLEIIVFFSFLPNWLEIMVKILNYFICFSHSQIWLSFISWGIYLFFRFFLFYNNNYELFVKISKLFLRTTLFNMKTILLVKKIYNTFFSLIICIGFC